MFLIFRGRVQTVAATLVVLFFYALCLNESSLTVSFAFVPRPQVHHPQSSISTALYISARQRRNRGVSVDDEDDNNSNKNPRVSNARRVRPSRNSYSINQARKSIPNIPTPLSNDDVVTPRREDTGVENHFFSKKSLDDPSISAGFGGSENGMNNLFVPLCNAAGVTRPSRIQSLAWPKIITGNHALVADQTGSGKTLAYLIPLLQRALQSPSKKLNGAPRLLILAPTAELADQIRAVCMKISSKVPFKTMVITATGKHNTSIRDQIRLIQRQPVDVMISTPGRISTILRTRNSGLDLSLLQGIVLDEVDILLIDETFGPQLRTVGAAAPLDKTQFVFVTATLPDSIVAKVEKEFPGVVQVRGPGLHRVAPTVKERLVDVSVPPHSNRDPETCFNIKGEELLKALRQNRCRRTLIFCNTVESCRQVENFLNRKDRRGQVFEVGAYHNAMTPEARNDNLSTFSKGRFRKKGQGREEDVDYVLICTDRAARGVDFDAAPVDHVVIFDFPKDPAEYVRRVGRTARAGRKGSSTVFAYGWQLPIARKVMGSKLNSKTIAQNELSSDDDDEDDMGQLQPRGKRKRLGSKDSLVKGNIESGQLWE